MSSRTIIGIVPTCLGSLFLAALSTLGDWIWEAYIPRGEVIHGVVHGALIFAAIGCVLGLASKSRKPTEISKAETSPVGRGILFQTLIGIAISASFYPLYNLLSISALFLTWAALWVLTGLLYRYLAANEMPLHRALIRGLSAALLSGLAFWSISSIWTEPNPGGPNLAFHFLCWTWAFLPGFGALFLRWRQR